MGNVKVSLILPVYNSERFLNKCLDSVIRQTLKNIEVLIVNDGSTDESPAIIKYYAEKYPFITVINQENAGQALARNRALQIAQGEYCAFVDSDDYMEEKMLEILYQAAVASKADVVICNWKEVDEHGQCLMHNEHEEFHRKTLTKDEVIKEFLMNKKQLIEGFSWNKLIKRSIFADYQIQYPRMKYEDIPTMFKVLMKAKSYFYVNDSLYYYVQHQGSTVHVRNKATAQGYLNAIKMIKEILKEEDLLEEYSDAYTTYGNNCILREYGLSYNAIHNHSELKRSYQDFLKVHSRFQKIKPKEYKLRIKMILYKVGLLPIVFKYYWIYKKMV